MQKIEPNSKTLRLFFFWSGVIATFAYRVIIVLNFYSPVWVQIAWYIGTVGFSIYFWHRYAVQKKRGLLVDQYQLTDVLKTASYTSQEQKQALEYLVSTSKTSKSKYNSLFIFLLSVLALIVGIILDVTKVLL